MIIKLHNCLKCRNSVAFSKPISMTTGLSLHMGFECTDPCIPDTYGSVRLRNTMIIDLSLQQAWVDGSCSVPIEGCANYVKSSSVNGE